MSKIEKTAGSKKRPRQAAKPAYHHGGLKEALIAAARAILEKDGAAAMSLRAAAREAGVSQAAPYHHFEDKNALLAAVAAEGFKEFDAAMKKMMTKASGDPRARLVESGVAYVKFATAHPALFKLMFGSGVEKYETFPELVAAGERAFNTLFENVKAALAPARGGAQTTNRAGKLDDETALTAALSEWSRVHGLATLLVDGGLNQRYRGSVETLARAVLATTSIDQA